MEILCQSSGKANALLFIQSNALDRTGTTSKLGQFEMDGIRLIMLDRSVNLWNLKFPLDELFLCTFGTHLCPRNVIGLFKRASGAMISNGFLLTPPKQTRFEKVKI